MPYQNHSSLMLLANRSGRQGMREGREDGQKEEEGVKTMTKKQAHYITVVREQYLLCQVHRNLSYR